MTQPLTSIEICAGAGGMALGLEQAGFRHLSTFDNDPNTHQTLLNNRPNWNPQLQDIRLLDGSNYVGIDLFAGGVPCPPFSIAGQQKGHNDERDLFPDALRLIQHIRPNAVLLENVRGFAGQKFADYRSQLVTDFHKLGMVTQWKVLNASDYGVPQLRPRFLLIAIRQEYAPFFAWPEPIPEPPTVAETIGELMGEKGWLGLDSWMKKADAIAPTIVGGSKKHGGADLGPTRAKQKWLELGVDGKGIANAPPCDSDSMDLLPRLTLQMVARLQNFPDTWEFVGGKTAQYRQIGNALPPAVACHVGQAIAHALNKIPLNHPFPKQLELLPAQVA